MGLRGEKTNSTSIAAKGGVGPERLDPLHSMGVDKLPLESCLKGTEAGDPAFPG